MTKTPVIRAKDLANITTTIVVPRRIWQLLRLLAEDRALEHGGKPSVSALIASLAEAEEKARPRA
jgi:hypothetical protein